MAMSTLYRLPVLFLVASLGCAAPRAPAQAPRQAETAVNDKVFSLPYLMRDLPNGLRVIVVKTDYPDIVTIQLPVRTGSRNEVEPGKSGFAHFFEHMMFRGTKRFPQAKYGAILKNAGADQNAYTTDDYTNYHITFSKADLETVIELEADRFQNLSYAEDVFRTEALAVKGEYLKNSSNPLSKMFEVARRLAFSTHTYRHTTMGFLEDIEKMPDQYDYSKTFFDRWYRPEKTAVILVGDVEPEATFALVEKHFSAWKRGSTSVDIPSEPPAKGPQYQHIPWDRPTQPWLVFAFRGPAFNPAKADLPGLNLISQLYFSETSDVYRKLVTEERVADRLFAYFPKRRDPNLLWVGARLVDGKHAAHVRDALFDTLARARRETVPPERLNALKARLRYGFLRGLDNSEDIGGMLAANWHFEGTPETINELYRTYARLSAEDLRRLAERYFTDNSRVAISLGKGKSMPGLLPLPSVDGLVKAATSESTVSIAKVLAPSQSPLIDLSLIFAAGAANDPPGKRGLAALTAAMVSDGGSKLHSIDQVKERLFPMAAEFATQVDKEMTRFSGTVHIDNLSDYYRLVREQLLSPGWRPEDLERLKTQTKNAIRTDLRGNNDEELGKEALYSFIYGDHHPYGSLTRGALADLDAITLDDVRAFYGKHYGPQNATLGLSGAYPEAFLSQVEKDLRGLPGTAKTAPALPKPPAIQGHQARIIEKKTSAVAVSFGLPIDVRRGDADWVALWLVRSWLGEHRSSNSHLYERIREVRGMNYGDYAYIEYFPRGMHQFHPDTNLGRRQQIFQVWLRPLRNNNDAHFATRVALHELEKLRRDGLSQADFEATRNFLNKFVSLLSKTQSRQLGYALDGAYYGIEPFTDYVRKGLAALTVEDVNRAIKAHLKIDNMKFIFVTEKGKDLRSRLVKNSASPMTYNAKKSPELLAEDKEIARRKIGFDAKRVEIIPVDALWR